MGTTRSRLKGGNVLARVQRSLSLSHRRHYLPPPENPHGVPSYIMRTLANERLSADPQAFNLRLQQLLTLHELQKRGG
jgi:hypothetical protein